MGEENPYLSLGKEPAKATAVAEPNPYLKLPKRKKSAPATAPAAPAPEPQSFSIDKLFDRMHQDAKTVKPIATKSAPKEEPNWFVQRFNDYFGGLISAVTSEHADPQTREENMQRFGQSQTALLGAPAEALQKGMGVTTDFIGQKAIGQEPGWFNRHEGSGQKTQEHVANFVAMMIPGVPAASAVQLASAVATDPEQTWKGVKDSFTAVADPSKPIEDRIASGVQWAATVIGLGHVAVKGKVAFDNVRIRKSLEADGFTREQSKYIVDAANSLIKEYNTQTQGGFRKVASRLAREVDFGKRKAVAEAGAQAAKASGIFDEGAAPRPTIRVDLQGNPIDPETGHVKMPPAAKGTPELERYAMGSGTGSNAPAAPKPTGPEPGGVVEDPATGIKIFRLNGPEPGEGPIRQREDFAHLSEEELTNSLRKQIEAIYAETDPAKRKTLTKEYSEAKWALIQKYDQAGRKNWRGHNYAPVDIEKDLFEERRTPDGEVPDLSRPGRFKVDLVHPTSKQRFTGVVQWEPRPFGPNHFSFHSTSPESITDTGYHSFHPQGELAPGQDVRAEIEKILLNTAGEKKRLTKVTREGVVEKNLTEFPWAKGEEPAAASVVKEPETGIQVVKPAEAPAVADTPAVPMPKDKTERWIGTKRIHVIGGQRWVETKLQKGFTMHLEADPKVKSPTVKYSYEAYKFAKDHGAAPAPAAAAPLSPEESPSPIVREAHTPAPGEKPKPGEKRDGNGLTQAQRAYIIAAVAGHQGTGRIHIDVPNDGTFDIEPGKPATEFLKVIESKRGVPTPKMPKMGVTDEAILQAFDGDIEKILRTDTSEKAREHWEAVKQGVADKAEKEAAAAKAAAEWEAEWEAHRQKLRQDVEAMPDPDLLAFQKKHYSGPHARSQPSEWQVAYDEVKKRALDRGFTWELDNPGGKPWVYADTEKFEQSVLSGEKPAGDVETHAETGIRVAKSQATETPTQPSTPEPEAVKPAEVATGPFTLEEAQGLDKRIRSGEVTADEIRSAFKRAVDSKEAVIAQLNKLTIEQLKKMGGSSWARTKAEHVKATYDSILSDMAPGQTISYGLNGPDSYSKALARVIEKQTDEDLQTYASNRKKHVDELKSALSDPQTLSDFETFIHYRGKAKLSSEQLVRYDELVAERAKATRSAQAERESTVNPITAEKESGEGVVSEMKIVEHFHTKRGHNVFIVQPGERVTAQAFKEMATKARMLKGNYARSFQGSPAGFQFDTEEAAQKFVDLTQGKSVSRVEQLEERKAEAQAKATGKLSELADKLEADAEERLNRDRRQNTYRQANQAASAEADARADIAMAKTMRSLAQAIESGEAKHLGEVKAKTHVETLQRLLRSAKHEHGRKLGEKYEAINNRPTTIEDVESARYPYPGYYARNLKPILDLLQSKPGAMRLVQAITKKIGNNWEDVAVFRSSSEIEQYEQLIKLAERYKVDKYDLKNLKDQMVDYRRLQAMGIVTEAEFRAALREFFKFRSGSPKADPIKEAERALIGTKIEGFFPTPKSVIERMMEVADVKPGERTLEPSAGKGDIAEALQAAGTNPDTYEISSTLRELLRIKGLQPGGDFMEGPAVPRYDKIVMNPPFEKRQDVAHVRRAYEMLNPGGRLVAIMSEGPFFGTDVKAGEFRAWLDELGGVSEKLPEGSFKGLESFNQTGVNVRMVTIDKPAAKVEPAQVEAPIDDSTPAPKEGGDPLEQWGGTPAMIAKIDAAPVAIRRLMHGYVSLEKDKLTIAKWMQKEGLEKAVSPSAAGELHEAFAEADLVRPIAEFKGVKPLVNEVPSRILQHDNPGVIVAKVGDQPIWTDTHQLVVGPPPKGYEPQHALAKVPNIDRVWDPAQDALDIAQEIRPIAFRTMAEMSHVLMSNEDGRLQVQVNPGYIAMIEKLHPGVIWKATKSDRQILAVKDGKLVGILMPMEFKAWGSTTKYLDAYENPPAAAGKSRSASSSAGSGRMMRETGEERRARGNSRLSANTPKADPTEGAESQTAGNYTAEEFAQRIDFLRKVAKGGGANVFADLKSQKYLGFFEHPSAKYRHGRIRIHGDISDAEFAETLAHEVAHQIDSILTRKADPRSNGRTSGDLDILLNTKGEIIGSIVRDELIAVTKQLVGDTEYKRKVQYYRKPQELYARFLQAIMFHPTIAEEFAPIASKKFLEVAERHPIVNDYLTIAKGGMIERPHGRMFFPDARQQYIKNYGRYLGTKAYGNEVLYRSRRAWAIKTTEDLITEKFKGVKDKPELLFDAAEGVKSTKGDKVEFGTRIRKMLELGSKTYEEEAEALLAMGYKKIGVTQDDQAVFVKWRKTPLEAELAYNQLSDAGKALIREYTADRREAKDLFNREMQKEYFKIEADIEGYVHHFGFEKKNVPAYVKKFLKERKAAAQKQRGEAVGFRKDFKLATAKALTELQIVREWNDFVHRQLALVAEPITRETPLKQGWRKIEGSLMAGIKELGEDRTIVQKEDGTTFLLKKGKQYQVPAIIYDRYIKGGPFGEELSSVEQIQRSLNSYWQRNILIHPGSAMTNFISGAIQFGGKFFEDFYRDLLYHDGAMVRTRSNVLGLLNTMTPGGWKGAADWTYGGDESLLYEQFFSDKQSSRGAFTISGRFHKAQDAMLKPYKDIERFWKKVIVNSELAKEGTASALHDVRQRKSILEDPEFLTAVNDVIDMYAYDYQNIPLWLEATRKIPIIGLLKPFMAYPYKYMKMMTSMAGGIFDQNLSPQDRWAKLLALGTIVTAIYLFKKSKEQEAKSAGVNAGVATTDEELKLKSVVNPRGRLYFGKDADGKELYVRTAKYPFFNAVDAVDALVKGDPETAAQVLRDQVCTIGPVGKLIDDNFFGRHGEFDKFKDMATINAETAASFIPYGRIAHDVAEVLDPKQRNLPQNWKRVFGQYVPTTNPELRERLAGPEARARVPLRPDELLMLRNKAYGKAIELVTERLGPDAGKALKDYLDQRNLNQLKGKGAGGLRETIDLPVSKHQEDALSKFLGGVIIKRIDPEWYERFRDRAIENKRKSEERKAETGAVD